MAEQITPDDRPGEPERFLDQREIDEAIGFAVPDAAPDGDARAMVGAGAMPRERMPMLPIIMDDLCGRLSLALCELFGGDAVVDVEALVPRRYLDLIDEVVLPAQVVTFSAAGWDGHGLLAMGPDVATLALETLLGSRSSSSTRPVSRPYSNIESAILIRIADLVLQQAEGAFQAVTPVAFRRERHCADPRLATIARAGDTVVSALLRVSLDGTCGRILMAFPLSMLEPALAALRSSFSGSKGARGDLWANHLATEVWQSTIEAETVLHETRLPLRQVLALAVGDTLMFDMRPGDLVEVRCAGLPLTRGHIGRVEGRIAVQLAEPVSRPRPPRPEGLSL